MRLEAFANRGIGHFDHFRDFRDFQHFAEPMSICARPVRRKVRSR